MNSGCRRARGFVALAASGIEPGIFRLSDCSSGGGAGASQVDEYDAHQARTRTQWFVRGHDEAAAAELRGCGLVRDAGCATGSLVALLDRQGVPVVGTDLCAERLEVAKFRRSTAQLVVADLTELGFADGAFDGIAALRVLQHLSEQDRVRALQELARVSVPQARLVVTVYNARRARQFGMKPEEGEFPNGIRYHAFEVAELEEELAASGWELERVSGYGVVLGMMQRLRGGIRLYKALARWLWRLEKACANWGGTRVAEKGQYLFARARKSDT